MQRRISALLATAAALILILSTGLASEALEDGEWSYTLENGTAVITKYSGKDKHVKIPALLGNCAVTGIGKGAFFYKREMESVEIPEGVVSIGNEAFLSCIFLESAELPGSLQTIGEHAFSNCLIKEVHIPAAVRFIGQEAFNSCNLLTDVWVSQDNPVYASVSGVLFDKQKRELHTYPTGRKEASYEIPEGTLSIGPYAFYQCESLTKAGIPQSVKSIASHAFADCGALEQADLLEHGVTTLGEKAFSGCISLTRAAVPHSLTDIGFGAFANCGNLKSIFVPADHPVYASYQDVLFEKAGKVLHSYPCGRESDEYAVPEGIARIGGSAFAFCKQLAEISIPGSVREIGEEAFFGCDGLAMITLPRGMTEIGESAFQSCESLREITLGEGITEIRAKTFDGCFRLGNIIIPEGVLRIGNNAFRSCFDLEKASIPASTAEIDQTAFYGCRSLTSVKASPDNPVYRDKDGVLFDVEKRMLHTYPAGRTQESYAVPEGTLRIGKNSFYRCSSLVSVTLPESLTEISARAFSFCDGLKEIAVPLGVTDIGKDAFYMNGQLALSVARGSPAERYASENGIPYVLQ